MGPTGRPAGVIFRDSVLRAMPFHFDPMAFDAEITAHGTNGQIHHGQVCPCARVETQAPRAGCPSCKGLGWLYPEGMRCQTWMMLAGRDGRRTSTAAGAIGDGQVIATAHSGAKPGRGDIWYPCGETHVVHQLLRRSSQQVDQADLRAALLSQRRTNNEPAQTPRLERVLYPNAAIESCWYERDEGGAAEAVLGTDFVVNDQMVTWTGRQPSPGTAYTLRYTAPAAYMIADVRPQARMEAGQNMPWRVTLERLDKMQANDLR